MKHCLAIPLLIFIFSSCNNKASKEKQESENKKQAAAINYLVGIGKIAPENDVIQLSSPVNGIVQKIYKKENDTVKVGMVILELNHDLEDARILELNHEINTQAAQVKVEAAAVGEYEARVNNATTQLQHLQNLLSKGAETQQTVDDQTTNLKTLNANLQRLQASVVVAKRKWLEAKTNLNSARIERDQKIIRSPVNGRILELTVLIGGAVSLQQSFAQISPDGRTIAICEIDELNAENIFVGQKGFIRNVGSSDTLSTGSIYFASSFLKKKSLFTDQSGEKEDRRVRTLKMMLDSPDKLLLNARVECVIDITNNLKK